MRGEEKVRRGRGREVLRSKEEEELLLLLEEITDAFLLRAARAAAEPDTEEGIGPVDGGEGGSSST